MGKRFSLQEDLDPDRVSLLEDGASFIKDRLFPEALLGVSSLLDLLNSLWESNKNTTTAEILGELNIGTHQVLIPYNLHDKLSMVIKVLGGTEEAEKFFIELEESTEIK